MAGRSWDINTGFLTLLPTSTPEACSSLPEPGNLLIQNPHAPSLKPPCLLKLSPTPTLLFPLP